MSMWYVKWLLIMLRHESIKRRRAPTLSDFVSLCYVKSLLIMLRPENVKRSRPQIFSNFPCYVLCERSPYHATTWKYKTEECSNFLQFCEYVLWESSRYLLQPISIKPRRAKIFSTYVCMYYVKSLLIMLQITKSLRNITRKLLIFRKL